MDRSRLSRISALSLPLIGGMLSQNILNLVDTAMVGHLGPAALAGVGVASFVNFMAIAAIMGLSSSVQAMVARRIGEGRQAEAAVPLNGGLFLACVIGAPTALLLFFLIPSLFPLLNPDSAVVAQGSGYLEMRLIGVVAVGMNFSFRGYWAGVSLTRYYLRTIVFMHVINIVLSYGLIFGAYGLPELGAKGAGLGTSISLWIGCGTYWFLAWRHGRQNGFLTRTPRGETMQTMLRLALPMAGQQFLFAAGFTVTFWIAGQVSTEAVAAAQILINLLLVAMLPSIGLGMAAMTLASESLGRKAADEAKQWGWDVLKVCLVVSTVIGLPAVIAPNLLLSAFTTDSVTIATGATPLRLVGLTIMLDTAGMIMMHALLGAGAAKKVASIAVSTQWLLGLPLAYLAGPYLGYGLLGIWCAMVGYRLLQTVLFTVQWHKGAWAEIRI